MERIFIRSIWNRVRTENGFRNSSDLKSRTRRTENNRCADDVLGATKAFTSDAFRLGAAANSECLVNGSEYSRENNGCPHIRTRGAGYPRLGSATRSPARTAKHSATDDERKTGLYTPTLQSLPALSPSLPRSRRTDVCARQRAQRCPRTCAIARPSPNARRIRRPTHDLCHMAGSDDARPTIAAHGARTRHRFGPPTVINHLFREPCVYHWYYYYFFFLPRYNAHVYASRCTEHTNDIYRSLSRANPSASQYAR